MRLHFVHFLSRWLHSEPRAFVRLRTLFRAGWGTCVARHQYGLLLCLRSLLRFCVPNSFCRFSLEVVDIVDRCMEHACISPFCCYSLLLLENRFFLHACAFECWEGFERLVYKTHAFYLLPDRRAYSLLVGSGTLPHDVVSLHLFRYLLYIFARTHAAAGAFRYGIRAFRYTLPFSFTHELCLFVRPRASFLSAFLFSHYISLVSLNSYTVVYLLPDILALCVIFLFILPQVLHNGFYFHADLIKLHARISPSLLLAFYTRFSLRFLAVVLLRFLISLIFSLEGFAFLCLLLHFCGPSYMGICAYCGLVLRFARSFRLRCCSTSLPFHLFFGRFDDSFLHFLAFSMRFITRFLHACCISRAAHTPCDIRGAFSRSFSFSSQHLFFVCVSFALHAFARTLSRYLLVRHTFIHFRPRFHFFICGEFWAAHWSLRCLCGWDSLYSHRSRTFSSLLRFPPPHYSQRSLAVRCWAGIFQQRRSLVHRAEHSALRCSFTWTLRRASVSAYLVFINVAYIQSDRMDLGVRHARTCHPPPLSHTHLPFSRYLTFYLLLFVPLSFLHVCAPFYVVVHVRASHILISLFSSRFFACHALCLLRSFYRRHLLLHLVRVRRRTPLLHPLSAHLRLTRCVRLVLVVYLGPLYCCCVACVLFLAEGSRTPLWGRPFLLRCRWMRCCVCCADPFLILGWFVVFIFIFAFFAFLVFLSLLRLVCWRAFACLPSRCTLFSFSDLFCLRAGVSLISLRFRASVFLFYLFRCCISRATVSLAFSLPLTLIARDVSSPRMELNVISFAFVTFIFKISLSSRLVFIYRYGDVLRVFSFSRIHSFFCISFTHFLFVRLFSLLCFFLFLFRGHLCLFCVISLHTFLAHLLRRTVFYFFAHFYRFIWCIVVVLCALFRQHSRFHFAILFVLTFVCCARAHASLSRGILFTFLVACVVSDGVCVCELQTGIGTFHSVCSFDSFHLFLMDVLSLFLFVAFSFDHCSVLRIYVDTFVLSHFISLYFSISCLVRCTLRTL